MKSMNPNLKLRSLVWVLSFLAFVSLLHASGISSDSADSVISRTTDYPAKRTWLDVRDFGATPNNSTDDDAVTINVALDNAAAKGVDTVYVAEGTWDVAKSIKIPSNTTLLLSNNAILRLKPGAKLEYGIVTNRNATMANFKTDTGVRMIGGTIDGKGIISPSGNHMGIFLGKCSNSVIENVTVLDTGGEGIRIHSSGANGISEENLIRSCRVIRKRNVVENIMLSTHVENPRKYKANPPYTRYCRVENCYSKGGTHGIAFFNVHSCEAVGNRCEDNVHRGIIVGPGCSDCIIIRNIVTRAGSTGIHLAYDSVRCVIANNIVSHTQRDASGIGQEGQGIKAYAGFRDLIITGNQVSSNATDGIALEGGGESSDFVISNNISTGNRRDGIRIYAGKITLEAAHDISHGSVTGNICRNNRESGIRMGTDHPSASVSSIEVSGNSLHHNGKWGIHGDASKGVSVGTNTFDSNTLGNDNVTGAERNRS